MKIINPKAISFIERYKRLNKRFNRFVGLIEELNNRELPDNIIKEINQFVERINTSIETERDFKKQLRLSQREILKILENKLGLIPTNHNSNKFMGIGIALGVALGSALGASTNNMGMTGVWLPLGLVFGMAYGKKLDKKAQEEGKVLKFELKY
jgi:hypothetical protein